MTLTQWCEKWNRPIRTFLASDAKTDQIVEIMDTGYGTTCASGRIYKIDGSKAPDGRLYAWKRWRQGKTVLHPGLICRDAGNDPDANDWTF